MRYAKNEGWLLAAWLLVCLSVTGCAATPPQPPVVVPESVIPKLSDELKKLPEPSGAYWGRVTQWRKDWAETLKTLRPKSGG
jgi:hypothetical protein